MGKIISLHYLDNFIDEKKTENESHQLIVVATQAALEITCLPINQQIKILNHVKEKYPNFKLDKVESLLSDSTDSTFTKEELAKLLQFKNKFGAEKFLEIIENYKIDKNDNKSTEEPIDTTSFMPPPPLPGDCPVYIRPTLNFFIVSNTKTEPQDSTSEKTGGSMSDALNQIKNGAFNLKPSSERVLDEQKEKQGGISGLDSVDQLFSP